MLNSLLFFFCLVLFVLFFKRTAYFVQMGYLGFMMRGGAAGKETLLGVLALACELAFLFGVFKFFPFQINWIG